MIIALGSKSGVGKDTVGQIIQYLIWKSKVESGDYQGIHHTFDDFRRVGHISGWQIKKFADKLKDIVCLLIGCNRQDLESQEFKAKELGEEWDKYELNWSDGWDGRLDIVSKDFDKNNFLDKKGEFNGRLGKRILMTPRLMLQLIGTECFRHIIHENTWVNSLFSEYKPEFKPSIQNEVWSTADIKKVYPNWIITDLRYPNELKAIKDRGGITIRVNRILCPNCKSNDFSIKENEFGEEYIICNDCEHSDWGTEFNYDNLHTSETQLDDAQFDFTIDNSGTLEELIQKVKIILIELKLI